MNVRIDGRHVWVEREGKERMKNDSHLLYHVKKALIQQGYDCIKKRMWKDGHLTSDTQHYIRQRKPDKDGCYWAIYHEAYQVEDLTKTFNTTGAVHLNYVHI